VSARIAVCDYGVGNIRSVERAVLAAGGEPLLTRDPAAIDAADGLILPGVGAFGAAVDALEQTGLGEVVCGFAASGRPLLGVCLGFQVLFEASDESGGRRGLGLLPGRIERLGPERGKVPHMGWNALHLVRPGRLLDGLAEGTHAYFVHAYAAVADPAVVVATCDYGGPLVAVCEHGNVLATQFHPEKSGSAGLRIYANFVRISSTAEVRR
jgi:imidazole glycerol-phosphate synthase subunit HisH